MATRMQKYYDDHEECQSRTEKNQELYKEIANSEIDKFEISSNATVLSDAKNNIDVEKIKKILDTKYKEAPKRRSIRIETEPEEEKSFDETKEYDINAILEKAKEQKEVDYEKERLKKIRDTQFDILKNLKIDTDKEEKEETPEQNLMNLINTITAMEIQNKEGDIDPLDILTDLKGDGELTSPIEKEEIKAESVLERNEVNNDLDKSFYTSSVNFTESDFDDFNDLKAEVNSHKSIIIVVVVILTILIVLGLIFGLNHFLDLGLF